MTESRNLDDLRHLRNLAEKILMSNTSYSKNRNLIDKFFKPDSDISLAKISYFEKVYIRLTLIDSYYSTNMTKRSEGLRDLAKKISDNSKNDVDLKKKIEQYKRDLSQLEIDDIFNDTYGNPKGQAVSLISKYFYFVTNHNFPIEDRLVRKNLKKFVEMFGLKIDFQPYSSKSEKSNIINYLLAFDIAKESFSAFDNLIWLYGKISSNSYSLILNGKGYEEAVAANGNVNRLRKCINKDIGISKDLCEFIEGVK